jgi:5-methyltetrahydrofolate--homocysteine methyltransferase
MTVLEDLRKSVIEGDLNTAESLTRSALAESVPPEEILADGLVSAMREVGHLFEEGELFVPEMLIAARAMKGGLNILRPLLAAANIHAVGKVVIGTVQGDLHDLGKNLVGMALEGAGFEVIDLGADVPAEKFVQAVQTYSPDFIGLSALLTTTMPRMQAVLQALRAAGLREKVRVIVGGAPVTQQYAAEIRADFFAPDAAAAAERLLQAVQA